MRDGEPSFTRTMWYAIRETEQGAWVERSGAMPGTDQWRMWLSEAVAAARDGRRDWPAVARKNDIMRQSVEGRKLSSSSSSSRGPTDGVDDAAQAVPLQQVQPQPIHSRSGTF